MTKPSNKIILTIGVIVILASATRATGQTQCLYVGEPRTISDNLDVDHVGTLDPGQTLWINCSGGAVPGTDFDPGNTGIQVDALAKTGYSTATTDYLFEEVINNEVTLLLSVEGDPDIYFELPNGDNGQWLEDAATVDVDGMEFWGDSIEDSYSVVGDPGGVSVFVTSFQGATAVQITQSQILAGVQSLGVGLGLAASDIDVDAMMSGLIDNQLMFSVAPVADLDGGEIFVLDLTTMTATYLLHGDHLWDTNFNVMATFGVANENINALEAIGVPPIPVPSPSSFSLLALGSLILARWRRQVR